MALSSYQVNSVGKTFLFNPPLRSVLLSICAPDIFVDIYSITYRNPNLLACLDLDMANICASDRVMEWYNVVLRSLIVIRTDNETGSKETHTTRAIFISTALRRIV